MGDDRVSSVRVFGGRPHKMEDDARPPGACDYGRLVVVTAVLLGGIALFVHLGYTIWWSMYSKEVVDDHALAVKMKPVCLTLSLADQERQGCAKHLEWANSNPNWIAFKLVCEDHMNHLLAFGLFLLRALDWIASWFNGCRSGTVCNWQLMQWADIMTQTGRAIAIWMPLIVFLLIVVVFVQFSPFRMFRTLRARRVLSTRLRNDLKELKRLKAERLKSHDYSSASAGSADNDFDYTGSDVPEDDDYDEDGGDNPHYYGRRKQAASRGSAHKPGRHWAAQPPLSGGGGVSSAGWNDDVAPSPKKLDDDNSNSNSNSNSSSGNDGGGGGSGYYRLGGDSSSTPVAARPYDATQARLMSFFKSGWGVGGRN